MSLGTNLLLLFFCISLLHFLLHKLAFRLQDESRKLRPTIFLALYPAGKGTYLSAFPEKGSYFHLLCLEPITVWRGNKMVSLIWGMCSMIYMWSWGWSSLQSLLAESGGEYGFQQEKKGTAPRKMGELLEDT